MTIIATGIKVIIYDEYENESKEFSGSVIDVGMADQGIVAKELAKIKESLNVIQKATDDGYYSTQMEVMNNHIKELKNQLIKLN